LKLASYNRVRQGLANFNRQFGEVLVGDLKPLDLEEYQNKRESEGMAPATMDMELCLAKTMITKAFDNDMVEGKTVKAFRLVKRRLKKAANARKQIIGIKEYLLLLEAAAPHLRDILTVAYHTGMRTGELRTLQWSHIDREKGVIRLPADLTKESRAKVIPLSHHVKRLLAGLPRPIHHDFVLTYRGKPIASEGGLNKSFHAACKRAGLTCGRDIPGGIIFHDIRRTVKTHMLAAGVDKIYRDLILGHSLQGMDAHYLSPSEKDLHQAMGLYTAWIDGQLENVDHIVDQNS
jgi:integrase